MSVPSRWRAPSATLGVRGQVDGCAAERSVSRRARSSGGGVYLGESVPPEWPILTNPRRTPPTARSLRWGLWTPSCNTPAHWPLGQSSFSATRNAGQGMTHRHSRRGLAAPRASSAVSALGAADQVIA
jgi:hypothetical protein